jgi:hypothetical protein
MDVRMTKTFALLMLSITACAVDAAEDAADDAFLDTDDKADTGGISADDASGVLRVANELTYTQLRSAGVASTAARNIVAYRSGDDATAGTADDEQFDTLRELDAVPYVGPVAFAKLRSYAQAHGYIVASDHFILPACTPMTFDDAIAHFPPGQSWWHTGSSFSLAQRSRDCNEYTGCGPWHPSTVNLMQISAGNGFTAGAVHALPTTGAVDLQVQLGGSIHMFMSAPEPGHATTTINWDCNSFYQGQTGDHLGCVAKIQWGSYNTLYGYLPQSAFGEPVVSDGNRIELTGMLCSDGRYAFVSKLAAGYPGVQADSENNKNQIAIWGVP